MGGLNLLVTQQKARIAPRTSVALKHKRYLDRTTVLLKSTTAFYTVS